MSANQTKNEIQRQIFLYYSEDGLIDLALGLLIFGFGATLLIHLTWLVGLLGFIPLFIWFLGKRYLTTPRVGIIKPISKMMNQFKSFSIAMVALGAAILVLYSLSATMGNSFPADHPLALFGLILAVGISALGMVIKTMRLYFYGLLIFVAMAVGEILNQVSEGADIFLLSVLIAGSVIIISGGLILVKFLRKYPVINTDA